MADYNRNNYKAIILDEMWERTIALPKLGALETEIYQHILDAVIECSDLYGEVIHPDDKDYIELKKRYEKATDLEERHRIEDQMWNVKRAMIEYDLDRLAELPAFYLEGFYNMSQAPKTGVKGGTYREYFDVVLDEPGANTEYSSDRIMLCEILSHGKYAYNKAYVKNFEAAAVFVEEFLTAEQRAEMQNYINEYDTACAAHERAAERKTEDLFEWTYHYKKKEYKDKIDIEIEMRLPVDSIKEMKGSVKDRLKMHEAMTKTEIKQREKQMKAAISELKKASRKMYGDDKRELKEGIARLENENKRLLKDQKNIIKLEKALIKSFAKLDSGKPLSKKEMEKHEANIRSYNYEAKNMEKDARESIAFREEKYNAQTYFFHTVKVKMLEANCLAKSIVAGGSSPFYREMHKAYVDKQMAAKGNSEAFRQKMPSHLLEKHKQYKARQKEDAARGKETREREEAER